MAVEEAKRWIDRLREVALSAAERAESANERLNHALAEGDEVLAACLRQQVKTAEKAAQDVHQACDQMEHDLPG